jgi:outer membrane protein OmpA-like peptidoglycan-associated protein
MKRNLIIIFLAFVSIGSFAQNEFKFSDTVFIDKSTMISHAVIFEFDKAQLKDTSYLFLDSMVKFLNKNSGLILEVQNHCDTRVSNLYSNNLTQRRAQTVVNYLIEKSISKNRLVAKGYFDTKPLISEYEIKRLTDKDEIEKAHRINRRTEFVIISTDFKE